MKIDSDLRAAIRSAEKAQPYNMGYDEKNCQEKAAITEFFKRCPAKAAKIDALINKEQKAYKEYEACRTAICKQYGLRSKGVGQVEFASCDNAKAAFKRAGGKLNENSFQRWKFDFVVAELAGADTKTGAKILAKYGIKWE